VPHQRCSRMHAIWLLIHLTLSRSLRRLIRRLPRSRRPRSQGRKRGPNDAYSVLSTLNREQIRREIEVWNAGGGLSHELAKAVIEFEKQRHFPDFKWRFDPTIQEELLDSIELQLRGSNEYRDLSKAELVDFEDEFEEPAQGCTRPSGKSKGCFAMRLLAACSTRGSTAGREWSCYPIVSLGAP
jgi:hypothetical protein